MNNRMYAFALFSSLAVACGAPDDSTGDMALEDSLASTAQPLVAGPALSRVSIPRTRLDRLPADVRGNSDPRSNFMYFTTTGQIESGPFFAQFVNLRLDGVAQEITFCGGYSCTGQGVQPLSGSIEPPVNGVTTEERRLGVFADCSGSGDVIIDFYVSTGGILDTECDQLRSGIPLL